MKFGCCLNMISTKEDGTGSEWIETYARLGYDYLELPTAQMMALPDSEFEDLKSRLKDAGIPCETSNNLFPGQIRLTGPDVDMDAIIEYAERAFFKDAELGVQYCVFGSGPAKNVPEGYPLVKGYDQVVSLLGKIAPIARKNGIGIVLEPLNKSECNLINTFAEGVQLAKDCGESNVKVLVDFYHLSVEKEPVEHLVRDGREYLRHVHLANPTGRIFPEDIGEADYRPFIDALHEINYTGRISCEAYTDDVVKNAPLALKFMKENF